MATAIEQLEAMRRLGENWDGYGGASPRPEAIVLAQAFVGFIEAAMRGGARRARRPCTQVQPELVECLSSGTTAWWNTKPTSPPTDRSVSSI